MIPISIVIPVKNEAANLGQCLATLDGVAETVVVDSSSTDNTIEIARTAGAEVLQFQWQGGYPKKRNWVLQNYKFSTDWVLFLDADERLTNEFKSCLPDALSRSGIVGYWLNYRNHFMGRVLRHGVPQRKLALFKVGAGEYERVNDLQWTQYDMEVHEHPILEGQTAEICAPLEHWDFRNLQHFIERHNAYSTWESKRWVDFHSGPSKKSRTQTTRQAFKYRYLDRWWFAAAYFLFAYVIKLGFLDGVAGLNYALLKFEYFHQTLLKIHELQLAELGAIKRQSPQAPT